MKWPGQPLLQVGYPWSPNGIVNLAVYTPPLRSTQPRQGGPPMVDRLRQKILWDHTDQVILCSSLQHMGMQAGLTRVTGPATAGQGHRDVPTDLLWHRTGRTGPSQQSSAPLRQISSVGRQQRRLQQYCLRNRCQEMRPHLAREISRPSGAPGHCQPLRSGPSNLEKLTPAHDHRAQYASQGQIIVPSLAISCPGRRGVGGGTNKTSIGGRPL